MAMSEHARPYRRGEPFIAYITWMSEVPRGVDAKVPFSRIEIIHYDGSVKHVDVPESAMTKLAKGQYSYVWLVPADAALTKYYVTYTARVNGNLIRYTEIFEVTEPSGDFSTYDDDFVRKILLDWRKNKNKYTSEWLVTAPHPGCYDVRFYVPERLKFHGGDVEFFSFLNQTTVDNNHFPIPVPDYPSRRFESFDVIGTWEEGLNPQWGKIFIDNADFLEGSASFKLRIKKAVTQHYSIWRPVNPPEDWTSFETLTMSVKCPDTAGATVRLALVDVNGNKSYTNEETIPQTWGTVTFDLTSINPLMLAIARVEIEIMTGVTSNTFVYLDDMYLHNEEPPEPLGCTPLAGEDNNCGNKFYHYDAEFVVEENENLFIEVKSVMLMPIPQRFQLELVEAPVVRGINGII